MEILVSIFISKKFVCKLSQVDTSCLTSKQFPDSFRYRFASQYDQFLYFQCICKEFMGRVESLIDLEICRVYLFGSVQNKEVSLFLQDIFLCGKFIIYSMEVPHSIGSIFSYSMYICIIRAQIVPF